MILEATAVSAEGRISPQDLGLYSDANEAGLAHIVSARTLFPPVGAWLVAAAAVVLLSACAPKPEVAAVVRPVWVTRAAMAEVQDVAGFAGEIRARYETDMSFRVGGKILSRPVDLGASVRKGQVLALARLDAQDANLGALAARATLASAESDLEYARTDLDRYKDLLAKKFVSQGVYDQKVNAFKAATARRDAARAQAGVSGNQAQYTTLAADADGIVTAVSAEPGQVVAAGQPVLRVARLGEKDAVISIAENQLAGIKERPEARIALWANPAKLYTGRIREVAAAADPATRTYTVKVAISDADDQLRWGMSASVGFVPAKSAGQRAIVLPMTALTQTADASGARPAVWVVGADARVKLTPVEVGRYAEQGVVITAGLSGGETVVTAGVHKLQAGQQVRLLEDPAAAARTGALAQVGANAQQPAGN